MGDRATEMEDSAVSPPLELLMAYSSGRTYLAIPGPSVAPDRVLNAMHRAAPNIYEGDIVTMAARARSSPI